MIIRGRFIGRKDIKPILLFISPGISGALEDILETDSEFTISARPPSNLDDSFMNTPTVPVKHPGASSNGGTAKQSQVSRFKGRVV